MGPVVVRPRQGRKEPLERRRFQSGGTPVPLLPGTRCRQSCPLCTFPTAHYGGDDGIDPLRVCSRSKIYLKKPKPPCRTRSATSTKRFSSPSLSRRRHRRRHQLQLRHLSERRPRLRPHKSLRSACSERLRPLPRPPRPLAAAPPRPRPPLRLERQRPCPAALAPSVRRAISRQRSGQARRHSEPEARLQAVPRSALAVRVSNRRPPSAHRHLPQASVHSQAVPARQLRARSVREARPPNLPSGDRRSEAAEWLAHRLRLVRPGSVRPHQHRHSALPPRSDRRRPLRPVQHSVRAALARLHRPQALARP